MTDIKFDILPQRSALMLDHATELHVLVRLQAATAAVDGAGRSTPLNLALVLDRSSSMSGKPLFEAKRCARYVVDHLQGSDKLSLVIYDDDVAVLLPATDVSDKNLFKDAIDSIDSRGCTALFAGWQKGMSQAEQFADGQFLSRVLLLSDGCANKGPRTLPGIIPHVAAALEAGVSTSTYGLGRHFNEKLMLEIARAGGGQSYYGESAEDLMDPFKEELSLMSALCARNINLKLSAPDGVRLELLNGYREVETNTWQMPDLAYQSEAWALLKIIVPRRLTDEHGKAGLEDVNILKASITYTDMETDTQSSGSASLCLPRVHNKSWAGIAEDERVAGRVQEIRVARLQRKVYEAALDGDWDTLNHILCQAEQEAGDNAWVKESIYSLREYAVRRDRARTSKEALYVQRKMSSRLAEHDESFREYNESIEAAKPGYLRKKREQGKGLYR